MKQTTLGLMFLLGATAASFGCKKTAPPPVHHSGVKVSAKADLLKPGLDVLRQGTDVSQFRDGLNHINTYLTRDPRQQVTPLASEEKEKLRKLYRLDDEETADIEAGVFRPRDAYYLEASCLFRDAARMLEVGDIAPVDQARICFEWVTRRIPLHEQSDEGLPPAFVLRRGFGGALDRAVAFLGLVRQFQMEGCLLAPPGPPDAFGPLLVGILPTSDQKAALYLFDPRLGLPISSPGNKNIATLDDARADPGLLKPSDITAAMVPKLEIYLVSPLEALSPRMRYLQGLLERQDQVVLHVDALRVANDLAKATGRDSEVWMPAAKGPSPTRALRQFLSTEDGGIDKRGRYQRFRSQQIPASAILGLQAMHLLHPQEIPEMARDRLVSKIGELFDLYALQPKEFFLHGHFDATLKRVDRMRGVLESEEAAKPLEENVFQRRLKDWRARVNEAYISFLVRKDPGGEAKVEALWNDDQYLRNVFQIDSDFPLEKFEKKMLSLIVFNACREPLGQQVNQLVASCVHEKAAQLQANLETRTAAGKDVATAKDNAGYAWKNARGQWNKFLDRYQFNAQSLPKRLAEIGQRWNNNELEAALNLWEQLHLDIHNNIEARLRLAEAQAQLQANSPALSDLQADLEALRKSDLPKLLNECREKATNPPLLAQRLELLARDWAPQGYVHWLSESTQGRSAKQK
jgi:hypothetical protein